MGRPRFPGLLASAALQNCRSTPRMTSASWTYSTERLSAMTCRRLRRSNGKPAALGPPPMTNAGVPDQAPSRHHGGTGFTSACQMRPVEATKRRSTSRGSWAVGARYHESQVVPIYLEPSALDFVHARLAVEAHDACAFWDVVPDKVFRQWASRDLINLLFS